MKLTALSPAEGAENYADIITDSEAYAHLRVGSSPSDSALIQRIRTAALQQIEAQTNLQLRRVTGSAYMPALYRAAFPVGPNVEISAVEYKPAGGGDLVTLDASKYSYDTTGLVQRVEFYNAPTVHAFTIDPVKITFEVGYERAADVPEALVQAAFLLLGHFYENRQENVTGAMPTALQMGVKSLINPYRVAL